MTASPEQSGGVLDTRLHCPACEYNLTGVLGDQCPECGWEIDVDALASEGLTLSRRTQRVGVILLSLICGLVLFGLAISAFFPALPFDQGDAWSVFLMVWVAGLLWVGVIFILIAWAGWTSRSYWPLRSPGLRRVAITASLLQWATLFGLFGLLNESVWGEDFLAIVMFAVLFSMPGVVLLFVTYVAFRAPSVRSQRSGVLGGGKLPAASNQASFCVAAIGPFEKDQVSTEWTDELRMSTTHLDSLIEQTWLDQKEAADREGRLLFNGEMGRLVSAECSPNKLHLVLGATNYRDFVGTNLYNGQLFSTKGAEHFSNPLGTTATVITRDGWIAYGRRSHRVAFHSGYLHTFGGALEMQDRGTDGRFDVFAALQRELGEELGLEAGDVERIHVTGLVRDREIHQPELLLDVYVRLGREELLGRLDLSADDQEHTAIEWCADEPGAVVPFLQAAGKVAPVCTAAILLHGLLKWGTSWYERASIELFGALPEKCRL
jgi:8-oxo-dGTP pyrophosphatase MutT (NUDIX family)